MKKSKKIIFIPAVIAVLLTNCKSANNTQKGTGIGVAAGATAGALIGGGGKSSIFGALIGAAVGGGAGYLIGHHMGKQAHDINNAAPVARGASEGQASNIPSTPALLLTI